MARERAQEKIGSGNEEFKRFEEEVVERHQKRVVTELGQKLEELEELDRRPSGELQESGRYIDKAYSKKGGDKRPASLGQVEAAEAKEACRKCLRVI